MYNQPMRMEELSKGEVLVSAVASAAHEKWRAWWKVKNSGQEVPRMKETKDSAWIVVHGGNAVDINVPYDQLPADWQLENKTSAQAAVGQIQQVRLEGGENWINRLLNALLTRSTKFGCKCSGIRDTILLMKKIGDGPNSLWCPITSSPKKKNKKTESLPYWLWK